MLVLPSMKTMTMAIKESEIDRTAHLKKERCEFVEHKSFESKAGSTKRLKGNAANILRLGRHTW